MGWPSYEQLQLRAYPKTSFAHKKRHLALYEAV
jgi:hypothetical protein